MTTQLAVIYERTIHHEGDERSRTHPGHGYPAYDEKVRTIENFDDEEAMRTWIKEHHERERYSHSKFTLIKYEEIPYHVSVEVKVG